MKKLINGYNNYYISDSGELENSQTGKKLQGKVTEGGYRYYTLSKDNKKTDYYAHRLVAEYFIPNPDNLPVVNHIDGNKLNNNISNLEWVSCSENTSKWHASKEDKTRQQYEKYTDDLEDEQWLEIPDFPNYRVSSYGRVRNIKTGNVLHPSLTCGYYKVRCSYNGVGKDFMIHQLVYKVFNNDFFKDRTFVIDHIDGNKLNNRVNNLRKITASENAKAALYETGTNSSCKKVAQYSLQGDYIATYPSAAAAARALNLDSSVISQVCRGQKYKSHGGFTFKYI